MQDKREKPRREIQRTVHVLAPGKPPVACTLLDVSELGVRLGINDTAAVPDNFVLALTYKVRRWCQVIWRRDKQIGIKFMPNLPQTESKPDSRNT